jgi:hypothetical protein
MRVAVATSRSDELSDGRAQQSEHSPDPEGRCRGTAQNPLDNVA